MKLEQFKQVFGEGVPSMVEFTVKIQKWRGDNNKIVKPALKFAASVMYANRLSSLLTHSMYCRLDDSGEPVIQDSTIFPPGYREHLKLIYLFGVPNHNDVNLISGYVNCIENHFSTMITVEDIIIKTDINKRIVPTQAFVDRIFK